MYNVSNSYIDAMQNPIRSSYITGTMTLKTGEVIDITNDMVESISCNNKCVDGDALEFGQMYTGELSLELNAEINRYLVYDAVIKPVFHLVLDDNTEEIIEFSPYNVIEATREWEDALKITAYDDMQKFQTKYDGTTKVGTAFELLSFICEKVGVPLETTQAEIEAMPNGTESFGISNDYGWENWIDIVSDLCECLAGFGFIGPNGGLVVRGFQKQVCANITSGQMVEAGTASDFEVYYSGITIAITDGVISSEDESKEGLVMEIDDNKFFSTGTDSHLQAMCDSIWNVLRDIRYTPSSVPIIDDPRFQLGDRLCISDFAYGDATEVLIFQYNWAYDDRNTIECSGENPLLGNAKSTTEKKLEQISKTIEAEKFIYQMYRNGEEIEVTNLQKIIQLLYAISSDATATIQGYINAYVTVDETENETKTPAEITLHYFLNGEEETEIVPKLSVHNSGFVLIPVFYVAGGDAAKANDLSVYMECTSGIATIPVYGSYGSLSGQGLKSVVEEWDGSITVDQKFERITPSDGWKITVSDFIVETEMLYPEIKASSIEVQVEKIAQSGFRQTVKGCESSVTIE